MNEDWTDSSANGTRLLACRGFPNWERAVRLAKNAWDVEDIVRSLQHTPSADTPVCESAPSQEDALAVAAEKVSGVEAAAAALVPLASLYEISLPAWRYDYDRFLDFPSTTRLARNRKTRGFWWRLFHH